MCIDDCTCQDDTRITIACVLCAKNFHINCVGFTTQNKHAAFTCLKCKELFKTLSLLKTVHDDISVIRNQFMTQMTMLQSQMTRLESTMTEKETVNKDLTEENLRLRTQVATLTSQVQLSTWQEFNKNTQSPDALITDCVLSNIDVGKLKNTKVKAIPTATIADLEKELSEHPDGGYNRIVLVAGANDLTNIKEKERASEIIPSFAKLLDVATSKANQVCVSSICPRLDKAIPLDTVETVNANLQVLCEEKECNFIDSTSSFTLNDGTINDGYLMAGKGPSLSSSGANKLARNLKLRIKDNSSDVTKRNHVTRNKSTKTFENESTQGNTNSAPKRNVRPSRWNGKSTHRNDDRSDDRSHQLKGNVHYNNRGCYYCNENGHSSENCRHQGPVMCHSCGLRGHKAKHHLNEIY